MLVWLLKNDHLTACRTYVQDLNTIQLGELVLLTGGHEPHDSSLYTVTRFCVWSSNAFMASLDTLA